MTVTSSTATRPTLPKPVTPAPKQNSPSLDDAAKGTLIRQGQSGDSIRQLQETLIAQGANITADGKFGPETEKAVREFQAKSGIATDGLVGPDTVAALRGQTPPSLAQKDTMTDRPLGQGAMRAPTETDRSNAPSGTLRAGDLARQNPIGGKPVQGDAGNPAEVARGYLGKRSDSLQKNSDLHMDKWVPANVDCANFVSACLEKSGQIKPSEHNDSVKGLRSNLIKDGWKEVPLSEAKPGDVAIFDGPHGKAQHVELFNGMVNGKPQYIGSNNVNADGTQSITTDSGRWANQIHIYQKV